MTGRVKRDLDAVDLNRFAVGNRCDLGMFVKPCPRNAQSVTNHEVVAASPAEMVGMRVRHHRAFDGPPGIDKKVTPLTIEAEVGCF